MDNRELNKLTLKNKYSFPRIDDLFVQLSGAKVFSQMDLVTGSHWLKVAKESVSMTAFRTSL